jgi:hypothetical protein
MVMLKKLYTARRRNPKSLCTEIHPVSGVKKSSSSSASGMTILDQHEPTSHHNTQEHLSASETLHASGINPIGLMMSEQSFFAYTITE